MTIAANATRRTRSELVLEELRERLLGVLDLDAGRDRDEAEQRQQAEQERVRRQQRGVPADDRAVGWPAPGDECGPHEQRQRRPEHASGRETHWAAGGGMVVPWNCRANAIASAFSALNGVNRSVDGRERAPSPHLVGMPEDGDQDDDVDGGV